MIGLSIATMRDRLVGELGDLSHSRFLVYLMGQYNTFDVDALLEATDADDAEILGSIPESVDFGSLVGADVDLDRQEAVLDLLLYARDRLRTDPGVNAFLAIDIDIPLEELDAATQSIEFALASNAVVYIVPRVGDNLGVGIETGSVLEAIFRNNDEQGSTTNHQERVLFIHESGVRSAMIAAVQDRWEARVYAYEDREDLVRQLRLFVRDLARRELEGDLPRLD
jgi:hypothetical protein